MEGREAVESQVNQTALIEVPVDVFGKTISAAVIAAAVDRALFEEGPAVALNHIWSAFNLFKHEMSYDSAVKLAGVALRYAWENRPIELRREEEKDS